MLVTVYVIALFLSSADNDVLFAVAQHPYHEKDVCDAAAAKFKASIQTLLGAQIDVYCNPETITAPLGAVDGGQEQ